MAGLRRPRTRRPARGARRWPRCAAVVLRRRAAGPRRPPAGARTPPRPPPPARRQPAFVPGTRRRSAPPATWRAGRPCCAGPRPRGAGSPRPRRSSPASSTRTPEGTANIVAVVGSREDRHGRVWVRVRLPVLPNGTTGWVPRTALGGYGTVATRLDVDLRRLRATLFRAGRPVFRAAVGRRPAAVADAARDASTSATSSRATAARPTARSPSARARARRRSPTGPPAASSASTARTGPTCCPGASRTAASGCATRTSSRSRG